MATEIKRATVYLDPMLHKALRIKAAESSRSISDLILCQYIHNAQSAGKCLV